MDDVEFADRILPRTFERLNVNPGNDESGTGGAVVGGLLNLIFARQIREGPISEQLMSCNALAVIIPMIKEWEAEAKDRKAESDRGNMESGELQYTAWINKWELGESSSASESDAEEGEEAKAVMRKEDLEREERSRMMMGWRKKTVDKKPFAHCFATTRLPE